MAGWLFEKAIEVEFPPTLVPGEFDPEAFTAGAISFVEAGGESLLWPTLVDPETILKDRPPWCVRPETARIGLLDPAAEPKPEYPPWLDAAINAIAPESERSDFIDLDREEYLETPSLHLERLWRHFLDSID